MKNLIRSALQKILGFNNYLFLFSILTVESLRIRKNDKEFLYFIDIIPNEGIILDIGANIGITLIPLAKTKNKATVYAFEPMPENIQALKRVTRYFGLNNIKIFELALGNEPGELKMIMPTVKNAKMQGLSHIISESEAENYDSHLLTTVPVNKLDNVTELKSSVKISAIKIDVENFEYFVLKGGRNLLSEHKPLIYCELWENEKRKMTIDYLTEMGYQVKCFLNGQLFPYTNQETINFFFIFET